MSRWPCLLLAGCAARADSPPAPPALPHAEAWWTAPQPCPEGATLSDPQQPEGAMPWPEVLELADILDEMPQERPLVIRCVRPDGTRHGPETLFLEHYRVVETPDGPAWAETEPLPWTPLATRHYREGALHGAAWTYDHTGAVRGVARYADGVRHGDAVAILGDDIYLQSWADGRRHGVARWWDGVGVLRAEGWWVEGQRHGDEHHWDTEGVEIAHGRWVDGVLVAWEGTSGDPRGYRRATRRAREPLPTCAPLLPPPPFELVAGDCPEGAAPVVRQEIVGCERPDGVRHGPMIRTDDKRILVSWSDGRRVGTSYTWGANGLYTAWRYQDGEVEGLSLAWDQDGALAVVGLYRHDEPRFLRWLEAPVRPLDQQAAPPPRVAVLRAPPGPPAPSRVSSVDVFCSLDEALGCTATNLRPFDLLVEEITFSHPTAAGRCDRAWRPDMVLVGKEERAFTAPLGCAAPLDIADTLPRFETPGDRVHPLPEPIPQSELTVTAVFSVQGARFIQERTQALFLP
ncbi:MAG: hypothetical protein H6739_40210 [Alphaproteobacteria bacterium]|nr:hypothetical protein [Alphaproteobacteria bacterium]